MRRHQLLELGDQVAVAPKRELCVYPLLECRQSDFLEPLDRALGERLVRQIGESGTAADPDFANEQHKRIKLVAADIAGAEPIVLYGGSVNLENCCSLAGRSHIDGLFIGRAAWEIVGYLGIIDKVVTRLERTG